MWGIKSTGCPDVRTRITAQGERARDSVRD